MDDKLYEITDKLVAVDEALMKSGGELTPELEKSLNESQLSLQEKTEGIGFMLRNMAGKKAALSNEIARLKSREAALARAEAWLKTYLKDNMIKAKLKKSEYACFNFTVKNNKSSIEIIDESKIPRKYKIKEPTKWRVDKDALKTALVKAKKDKRVKIEGARLIENKTHLLIT